MQKDMELIRANSLQNYHTEKRKQERLTHYFGSNRILTLRALVQIIFSGTIDWTLYQYEIRPYQYSIKLRPNGMLLIRETATEHSPLQVYGLIRIN